MISHWNEADDASSTGAWLRLCVELETEPEIPITVDPDDGLFCVGNVVKVDSIEVALELARVA